jgi:hypothetical protein
MRRDRRGFAPIALILLVVAGIVVLGGVFYYFHKVTPAQTPAGSTPPIVATSTTPTSTATSTPPPPITIYRSYLSPSSGAVGTVVTIHASGFASTGNQVTLNGMVSGSLDNLFSPDGKMLVFTVPSTLGPNCKADQACPMYLLMVTAGSYKVNVILPTGATENIGTFMVTGGGLRVQP